MRQKLSLLLLGLAIWQGGQAAYIHAKAELAQQLIARAWQQSLLQQRSIKPWPWADTWPVARLRLPGQHRDLFVLAGDSGNSLAFGPGHLSASAMPGSSGTSIIGGHRDTHFRGLNRLQARDTLTLQDSSGRWQNYRVISTRIVDSRTTPLLLSSPGQQRQQLQLITCYPFDGLLTGGPLRYLVTATATDPTITALQAKPESSTTS